MNEQSTVQAAPEERRAFSRAYASHEPGGLQRPHSMCRTREVSSIESDNPALAATILNGALGRFQCAYVNHILSAAMMSRELINSSNWAPINPFARRDGAGDSTGSCPDDRTSNAMGSYTRCSRPGIWRKTARR